MGILALIPKPVLAASVAALAMALLVLGIFAGKQTLKLGAERTAHAQTREAIATATARQQADFRKQEQAWTATLERVRRDTRTQLAAAEIDGATATAAGDRLRQRLSQLAVCSGTPAAPPVAAGSAPATATADLLADVQRRLDQAADQLARFADASHIAGQACERTYDSTLTTTTKGQP